MECFAEAVVCHHFEEHREQDKKANKTSLNKIECFRCFDEFFSLMTCLKNHWLKWFCQVCVTRVTTFCHVFLKLEGCLQIKEVGVRCRAGVVQIWPRENRRPKTRSQV